MYYVRLDTMQVLTRSQLDQLFPLTGFPPDQDMTLVNLEDLDPTISILIEGPRPEVVAPDTVAPGGMTVQEDGYVFREWVMVPATADQWLAFSTAKLVELNQLASRQITRISERILTLSYGEEEWSDEEAAESAYLTGLLTLWQKYKYNLGKVNKQTGWPSVVTWPVQPEIPDIEADPSLQQEESV